MRFAVAGTVSGCAASGRSLSCRPPLTRPAACIPTAPRRPPPRAATSFASSRRVASRRVAVAVAVAASRVSSSLQLAARSARPDAAPRPDVVMFNSGLHDLVLHKTKLEIEADFKDLALVKMDRNLGIHIYADVPMPGRRFFMLGNGGWLK